MPSSSRLAIVTIATICLLSSFLLVGCAGTDKTDQKTTGGAKAAFADKAFSRNGVKVQGADLNDPIRPVVDDNAIAFGAAKNEWAGFALQVSGLPKTDASQSNKKSKKKIQYSLRMESLRLENGNGTIGSEHFSAAQILPMPVDVNRAGFVRQTGLTLQSHPLPRALLPVAMDNGAINLSAARDPGEATNPQSLAGNSAEPLLFWIDLHVPAEAAPGEYVAVCDLVGSDSPAALASVPVRITIYDFVLPEDRHLLMTSRLGWDDLRRLYPDQFETVTPRLMNRTDAKYAGPIKTLDSIIKLAQLHRTEIVVPRLQPTVKWPTGQPPQVDWSDLDTVIAPWLSGEAFADKIPLGFWPLPAAEYLDNFDRKSQVQYWTLAAAHFDQKEWLSRAPVVLGLPMEGRAGTALAIQMSADAAQILAAHPNVRVAVPLDEDQIQLASSTNPNFIDPAMTNRLGVTSAGIVFNTPIQKWPSGVIRPQRWLRNDIAGLVPYAGAGDDERNVRIWSWLAFLRQAALIQWDSPLPRTKSASEPAEANDLVWFYPGSWFGVDEPLATIQLKWLRRAQQDYEYLWLAKTRGEAVNASLMARLVTKPVEIQPGQTPDPVYALMTGTADPAAWSEGQKLLARTILLREPGQIADAARSDELGMQLLRWMAPQDQSLLMARSAQWGYSASDRNWVNLILGIDLYNASDTQPDQNRVQWTTVPEGWEVKPQPIALPAPATYHVDRFTLEARFNLLTIDGQDHRPAGIAFTNGYSNDESQLQFVLPVAPSERHGPGLKIDGQLDDWNRADAIQTGPMVRMLNRPAVQKQQLEFAENPSTVYTGWGEENFYVAFALSGIDTAPMKAMRNFVGYEFRRAWGEDLCEILIQPIFEDNSLGPVLHVVCKPAGQWVERKRDSRQSAGLWQPLEGTAIRYAGIIDAGDWMGEVAIPWRAITDRERGVPKLLRFNFTQHAHPTGDSASWAGPIDFGRDDSFMGLLVIRDSVEPGMAGSGK